MLLRGRLFPRGRTGDRIASSATCGHRPALNISAFVYDLRQITLLEGPRVRDAYVISVNDQLVMLERGWRPPVVEAVQAAERPSAPSPAAAFWPVPTVHVAWTRSPDGLPCPCLILPRARDDPIVAEFLAGDAVSETKRHLWQMGFAVDQMDELWETTSHEDRVFGRSAQAQRIRDQAAGRLADWALTGFRTQHGIAYDDELPWMPRGRAPCFPEAYALGCGTSAGAVQCAAGRPASPLRLLLRSSVGHPWPGRPCLQSCYRSPPAWRRACIHPMNRGSS